MKKKKNNKKSVEEVNERFSKEIGAEKAFESGDCDEFYKFDEQYDLYCIDPLEERDIGYETLEDASEENNYPENLRLVEYMPKHYMVFSIGAFLGDSNDRSTVIPASFTNLEAAKNYYNSIPDGEASLADQIEKAKELLGENDFYAKPFSEGYYVTLRIYCDHFLIIDKCGGIDIEECRTAIKKFRDKLNVFKKAGYTVTAVYKPGREWNCNERYYNFDVEGKDIDFTVSKHIGARYQNKERETIDFISLSDIINTEKDFLPVEQEDDSY